MALSRRATLLACTVVLVSSSIQLGCEDSGKKSAELSRAHVTDLARAAVSDAAEVRAGLPEGARQLEDLFREANPELPDPQSAKDALVRARDKVQDLRVAKSTFFAVAAPDGRVLRSDGETDEMVEKNLLVAYPGLEAALTKGYVEASGTMAEAARVRGREDAQWVAASPIKVDGEVKGIYVTGWSWSAYAYRLETAIRSQVLGETPEGGKVPLLYVYVLAEGKIFGAPISPTINAEAIQKLSPLEKAQGVEAFASPLEIDGRSFGVAVKRVPELGETVAIAVLRSET